jgi:hypothetical protein
MPGGNCRRVLAAVLVLFTLAACSGDDAPAPAPAAGAAPTPSPTPDPRCPLSGEVAPSPEVAARPAIAVKVENNPVAYPLSGLEHAEVVFEELVEGGATRFMAIYHCNDAKRVGPVRSARMVDPGIMIPITRILAAAGGNDIVRKHLKKSDIVVLDEDTSGKAMRRIPRPGISLEHTLYGNTAALRRLGSKRFDEAPQVDFAFGSIEGKARRVRRVDIDFGGLSRSVGYEWRGGGWLRLDDGAPLQAAGGGRITVDNVLIEQHRVNNSKTIVDVAGNPSVEIADETGRGRAVLLRDGRAIEGHWIRKKLRAPVRFVTKSGDAMVFAPGTVWVELVPDRSGEIKGSFTLTN